MDLLSNQSIVREHLTNAVSQNPGITQKTSPSTRSRPKSYETLQLAVAARKE